MTCPVSFRRHVLAVREREGLSFDEIAEQFRKSASHGVQIVTFDELLENLRQILEYAKETE